MKFLAILKDSLREAFDAKIIYFMIGLSALVVLFMFSLSFRPIDVEMQMRRQADLMTYIVQQRQDFQAPQIDRDRKKGPDAKGPDLFDKMNEDPFRVEVEKFEKDGGGNPWDGEYHFQIVFVFPNPTEAELARKAPLAAQIPEILRGPDFHPTNGWIDPKTTKAHILDANPDAPRKVAYQVDLKTNVKDLEHWPHEPSLLFGLWTFKGWNDTRGSFAAGVVNWIVNAIGASFTLILSIIITAFFIPNMLRKGTIDMLVVKPINRTTLLLYKYVGGLTFMFVNTAIIVFGVYLALGVRTGVWVNGFLISLLVLTFEFAIYYAFSTLFGVLTRSAIVSILVTCGLYLLLFIVGWLFVFVEGTRKLSPMQQPPSAFVGTVNAIHFVLPRVTDLHLLNEKLVSDSLPQDVDHPARELEKKFYESFSWTENLTVSLAFIAVMLGLSCWRFSTRDY